MTPWAKSYLTHLLQGALILYTATAAWQLIEPRFSPPPRLRTLAERVDGVTQQATVPTTMELLFESTADVRADCGPSVRACTRPLRRPCQIILPVDMPIAGFYGAQRAQFLVPDDAETVAHEILHCLVADWHDR